MHAEEHRRAQRNRIILWAVLAVVLVLLVLVAASVVPRWWAQTVGRLANGGLARSAWWGIVIGFVFAVLPATLLLRLARRWKGWKAPLALVVGAAILAAPNLFTLWVVVGTTRSAHAAQRTLDVQAPYFAGLTAWGVVLGVLVAIGIDLLWRSWRHRGKELKQMRAGHA